MHQQKFALAQQFPHLGVLRFDLRFCRFIIKENANQNNDRQRDAEKEETFDFQTRFKNRARRAFYVHRRPKLSVAPSVCAVRDGYNGYP